jgi:hypothetical protein
MRTEHVAKACRLFFNKKLTGISISPPKGEPNDNNEISTPRWKKSLVVSCRGREDGKGSTLSAFTDCLRPRT